MKYRCVLTEVTLVDSSLQGNVRFQPKWSNLYRNVEISRMFVVFLT